MWQYVIAVVSSLLVLASAVPLYAGILWGGRRLGFFPWIICSATALIMAIAYSYVAPLVNIGPPICIFLNAMVAFICMTWATRRQACGVDVFGITIVWFGLVAGGITLAIFLSKIPSAAPYVLYAVMAFDAWIVSRIMRRLIREPDPETALIDVLFGPGCAVGMFGITEHTLATWILPIYMSLVSVVFVSLVYFQRMRLVKDGDKSLEGA